MEDLNDLRQALFHLLASEAHTHLDRDHLWHMETLARPARSNDPIYRCGCAPARRAPPGDREMTPTRKPQLTRPPDQSDLDVAGLQKLLLPAELPRLDGWDMASHYLPCDASGGDFFGFQIRTPGRLLLLVADVSGHGARAAVIMAMLRAWLESHHAFERETANIAGDINELFNRMGGLGVFVTGVFASIDLRAGSIRYINCGHPMPRVIRASGTLDLLTSGHCLPLGVAEDIGLEKPGDDELAPGDALVIHTDGITEAAAAGGDRFDDARFDASISGGGDAQDIVRRVIGSLSAFRLESPRLDDECLLVVRRSPVAK